MTNLIRCEKGHFYDTEKFQTCPYCASSSSNMDVNLFGGGISATIPVSSQNAGGMSDDGGIGKTMPIGGAAVPSGNASSEKTMPLGSSPFSSSSHKPSSEEDVKTVAVIRKRVHNDDDVGINPVTGWLVCIQGREKGRDYRIYSGNNFLGRSDVMDICIRGDDTISREKHACVSYDDKKNRFYIYQGDSRGLVYVNNEAVFIPQLLNPYDVIEVGKTKLLFVPFCTDKFIWE